MQTEFAQACLSENIGSLRYRYDPKLSDGQV